MIDCLDGCPTSNIIHDVDGNKCGTGCGGKYLIIPEAVCSPVCNYIHREMEEKIT
jgi:hypothetical protein